MINEALDFYDDPNGLTLKEKIPNHDDVPDFIKTAEMLESAEMDRLPDDVFALVAWDGTEKMRKFACVDKGNTALSVMYFLENRGALPEEAQKTAAANLVTACGWYDMKAPEELEKIALQWRFTEEHKNRMRSERRDPRLYSNLRGMLTLESAKDRVAAHSKLSPGTRETKMEALKEGFLRRKKEKKASVEKTALIGTAVNVALTGAEIAGTQKKLKRQKQAVNAGMRPSQAVKLSELTGSSIMPHGSEKTAALRPHVDITGLSAPTVVVEEEEFDHYCLVKEGSARYPIDSAGQVMEAIEFFENSGTDFEPFDRHLYCTKLAARADAMGIEVPETVGRYGSTKLASDFEIGVVLRKRHFREGSSEHSLLDEMMEKGASVKPDVLATALEQFDCEHGLNHYWDSQIPDPYYTVFGQEKTAEWSYTDGNDTITATRLQRCARECRDQIKDLFDEDVAGEFTKDPQQIFDSLPRDSKRIIMRVASQVEE